MSEKSIKICYVVYSEEIWTPLIKRQVLELLQTAAKANKQLKIRLLYIFPWYWILAKRKQFKQFSLDFDARGLEMRFMPVPFPFPFPYFFLKYRKGLGLRPYEPDSAVFFWIVKLLVLPVLLKYAFIDNFKIFHGRSYPASAIILLAKRFNRTIKIIFDPRSDYPEENILQSSWNPSSYVFKFWKKEEQKLLKNASVTICITSFYQQHFQELVPDFNCQVIPNNVNCSIFKHNAITRELIRQKHNLNNKIVFCFLGSMGVGSWHCPYVYAKLIIAYRKIEEPHVFLFLIPASSEKITTQVFQEQGIQAPEYLILSPAYSEIPWYLSAADLGVFYLKKKKIALGTKVVEYNALGLPVLVNSNVISAAGYIKEYQTGLVLDVGLGDLDKTLMPLSQINFKTFITAAERNRIAKKAACLFSNEKVAMAYTKLYQALQQ